MRLCIVVGTRPQIIKSQPIIREILSRKSKISIIHTGQHYDYKLSKVFFEELKVKDPDYNLEVLPDTSSRQLGQIILKLEKPLKKIAPDIVIVPGDTRSALGAALCANRLGIKVAHVEAGARSMEFEMEEEINRRLIDHCSTLLFAPTRNCYKNLKKESVLGSSYLTGDTMYDVFLEFKKMLNLKKPDKGQFVLMTLHRKENIENYQKIKKILDFAKQIANTGHEVVFPIHPHTLKQIRSFGISLNGITTISPVKYSEMLRLLCDANLLLTDSGGLQKEAYWLDTPCITLRKSTEWIETLDGRHNFLLKTISNSSIKLVTKIIKQHQRKEMKHPQLFGKGNAGKKIASILLH